MIYFLIYIMCTFGVFIFVFSSHELTNFFKSNVSDETIQNELKEMYEFPRRKTRGKNET